MLHAFLTTHYDLLLDSQEVGEALSDFPERPSRVRRLLRTPETHNNHPWKSCPLPHLCSSILLVRSFLPMFFEKSDASSMLCQNRLSKIFVFLAKKSRFLAVSSCLAVWLQWLCGTFNFCEREIHPRWKKRLISESSSPLFNKLSLSSPMFSLSHIN